MPLIETRDFTFNGTQFKIELYSSTDGYYSYIKWFSGPTNAINVDSIWQAFKPTLTGDMATNFAPVTQAIQYYSGESNTADTITRTTGGGIFSKLGADTLNAYAVGSQVHDDVFGSDHGRNEIHLYSGRGDDTLNLYFNNINQTYAWGHHAQAEADDMSNTTDVLGSDTFNFLSTGTISAGRVVVGRLEDYDYTRDFIKVDGGLPIDLNNLASNMEVVYHRGSITNQVNVEPQAWLVIRTLSGTGGYIVYALEGDRANPAGLSRITEPHFITNGVANEIVALFNQAGRAKFIDPQNFVPLGYAVQGTGHFINDSDTNITSANAPVIGTTGGDLIAAGINNDTVSADVGNDRIWGGSGHDLLNGDGGNDSLSGNTGNDTLNGGAGTDTVVFLSGATASINLSLVVSQITGEGTDTFISIENITSGTGSDTVTGSSGANVILTGGGHDVISAGAGNDSVDAGVGNDRITYTSGLDTIIGGDGADTLIFSGSPARSVNLISGANPYGMVISGIENLTGGTGADSLSGNAGGDLLTGGTGDDLFRYQSANQGGDTIIDFNQATGNNDRFSISASGFGGLSGSSLAASQFAIRTTSSTNAAYNGGYDASDRFVYNTTTQKLYFDLDGLGGAVPNLIATLQGSGIVVGAEDIWLFT